jgi:tRNA pseudouridine55 synthase
MMEYLLQSRKQYRAVIKLGIETDTYDSDGETVASKDASGITEEEILTAISRFKGKFQQTPPMYSAIKKDGKRLYNLARAGVQIEREGREVEIHRATVKGWEASDLLIEIECGKGFYVRSLAHDLGQILGVGGHIAKLERTRVGVFSIDQAVSIEEVEETFKHGIWSDIVQEMDTAVLQLPAIMVQPTTVQMLRNGRRIATSTIAATATTGLHRVYGVDGSFIALANFNSDEEVWQPHKVFHS